MGKVDQDPFSSGQECRYWKARNCDKCIKRGHLTADNSKYILRCAIYRDIEVRMMSNEPISQRTIDICSKNDCPFRKEHYPKRKRKVNKVNYQSLFCL